MGEYLSVGIMLNAIDQQPSAGARGTAAAIE
jgi:hypothetical protein